MAAKKAEQSKKARHGYIWVTLVFFVISLIGHWVAAWFEFTSEQLARQQEINFSDYFAKVMSSTLENWQSEFLQLIWQVAGLAILWSVGSPQSKEGDERREEKIDLLVRKLDPQHGENYLEELAKKYPKS